MISHGGLMGSMFSLTLRCFFLCRLTLALASRPSHYVVMRNDHGFFTRERWVSMYRSIHALKRSLGLRRYRTIFVTFTKAARVAFRFLHPSIVSFLLLNKCALH